MLLQYILKWAYYCLQYMVQYALHKYFILNISISCVYLCVIGLVQEGSEFPQSHWLGLDQYWWRNGDAKCGAQWPSEMKYFPKFFLSSHLILKISS